jgi:hypothetical protein
MSHVQITQVVTTAQFARRSIWQAIPNRTPSMYAGSTKVVKRMGIYFTPEPSPIVINPPGGSSALVVALVVVVAVAAAA